MMTKKIEMQNLGLIDYDQAIQKMKDIHQQRVLNTGVDTILLLQHPAVVTKGRQLHGKKGAADDLLVANGIQVREADRGGLLTYHGPGQLVVYFILKFQDYFSGAQEMVCTIEKTLLQFLEKYQIKANIKTEHPGIWVGQKKIASVGLRIANKITMHGIALNVCNSLDVYQYFNPCGLSGDTMTSMQQVLQNKIATDKFDDMSQELGRDILNVLNHE
ncbi:hypothetical protein BVY03_04650 [bacterium K02(2017)]|nr:hypothetical protein BVY03_04650 [bacterium K02(2017)]